MHLISLSGFALALISKGAWSGRLSLWPVSVCVCKLEYVFLWIISAKANKEQKNWHKWMWCSICYRHLLFCPVSGYPPLKAGLHANVHVNTTKQKDTASGCRCKHSATSIQPFTEYINRFAFLNPGKRMGTEHAFTTTWAKLKPVQKNICFPTFFFSFSLFF